MRLTQIAAPLVAPVSLDQAKAHLVVEHEDHDARITQLIAAATAHFDGRDGWLGRALVEQTWELRLERFPPCVELPLPPLLSVDEIRYLDEQGVLTLLTSDKYQVAAGGWNKAILAPAYNEVWPSTRCGEPDAVRIIFTAGFARVSEDSPPELLAGVPEDLVTALLFQIELLYGRDPATALLLQKTIDALATKFQVGGMA